MDEGRSIRPRHEDSTITGAAECALPLSPEGKSDAPRFALVIYNGETTEVVRLSQECPVVVGRDFPAHVQIEDPKVSRQHARFVLQNGAVQVEDLGSRNGTRFNGARIERQTLASGDSVQLGAVCISLAISRVEPTAGSGDREAMVLRDPRVAAQYALAKRAAQTNMPVLVLGETGTGKEHLARTIHTESPRAAGPWRALNCSAIPANLVESTLFGHERGAFTGADRRAKGLFEDAAGRDFFLDEIAELALPAQAALLRVLSTKTFQRVGSTQELETDVRIVAATHCNLEAAVADGTFRRDLLYRINTVTLELPPLRDRAAELEPLVNCFLEQSRRQWGVAADGVEPEVLAQLRRYAWPGNMRQLRNAIERAALVAPARRLRLADLPPYLRDLEDSPSAPPPLASVLPPEVALTDAGLKPALREYESLIIQRALDRTGGNRLAAAKLMRIPRRTLYRRMQALGFAAPAGSDGDLELESE